MLRSCYKTKMAFGTDPNVTADVQWYFCEPTALDLGFPTPFVSRNYVEKGIWPDLGEVEGATRPWRNGAFPIPVPGTGEPCGPRSVWDDGWPGPLPQGLNRNDFGLAWCCSGLADKPGEPLFLFWPNDLEKRNGRHEICGTIASRVAGVHDFSCSLANRSSTSHAFGGTTAIRDGNAFTFNATITSEFSTIHSLTGSLFREEAGEHTISGTVARPKETHHTFSAFLGSTGVAVHSFGATLCPAPGVFITSDLTGNWQAPPAIHFRNTFIFAAGGQGYALGPALAGDGGGGGGFAAKFNAPVTPGQFYFFNNQPEATAPPSHVDHDGGSIGSSTGASGSPGGTGLGGIGFNGDINTIGGNGGSNAPDGSGNFYGGGGGGAAGMLGNGADGGNATIHSSGVSGLAADFRGNGGYGVNPFVGVAGNTGAFAGGGGGGSGSASGTGVTAGHAGEGQLILTWQAALHFVNATIYRVGQATHTIKGTITAALTDTHTFSGTIAAKIAKNHTIKGTLAEKKTATHTLKGALAAKKTATHTLKGALASLKTANHTIGATIVPHYILYDLFSGTNQALTLHPMNVGSGWTVDNIIGPASNLQIAGGDHVTEVASGQFQCASANAGSANHTCEFTFSPTSATGGVADATSRYADPNNFFAIRANWTGARSFVLYKMVAGVQTSLGTGTMPALVAGTRYTLKIVTTATTVTGSLSGPGISTVTVGPVSDSSLASNARFGFNMWRDDSLNFFASNGYQFDVY